MPRSTCITRKRNKAAKARNNYFKRMKLKKAIENEDDVLEDTEYSIELDQNKTLKQDENFSASPSSQFQTAHASPDLTETPDCMLSYIKKEEDIDTQGDLRSFDLMDDKSFERNIYHGSENQASLQTDTVDNLEKTDPLAIDITAVPSNKIGFDNALETNTLLNDTNITVPLSNDIRCNDSMMTNSYETNSNIAVLQNNNNHDDLQRNLHATSTNAGTFSSTIRHRRALETVSFTNNGNTAVFQSNNQPDKVSESDDHYSISTSSGTELQKGTSENNIMIVDSAFIKSSLKLCVICARDLSKIRTIRSINNYTQLILEVTSIDITQYPIEPNCCTACYQSINYLKNFRKRVNESKFVIQHRLIEFYKKLQEVTSTSFSKSNDQDIDNRSKITQNALNVPDYQSSSSNNQMETSINVESRYNEEIRIRPENSSNVCVYNADRIQDVDDDSHVMVKNRVEKDNKRIRIRQNMHNIEDDQHIHLDDSHITKKINEENVTMNNTGSNESVDLSTVIANNFNRICGKLVGSLSDSVNMETIEILPNKNIQDECLVIDQINDVEVNSDTENNSIVSTGNYKKTVTDSVTSEISIEYAAPDTADNSICKEVHNQEEAEPKIARIIVREDILDCHQTDCSASILTEALNQERVVEYSHSTISLNKDILNACVDINTGDDAVECYSTFSTERDIQEVIEDKKEKMIACLVCNKVFTKKDFVAHKPLHENNADKITCNKCGVLYNKYNSKHYLQHTIITCNICNKKVKYPSIKRHKLLHKPKEELTCSLCGRIFESMAYLVKHQITHTEKTHKCEICGESFHFLKLLNCHVRSHSKVNPFPCRYCKKSFKLLWNRQQHERLHTNPVPKEKMVCSICGKVFNNTGSFRRHEITHGDKKHKCEICGASFHFFKYLDRHMRSHSGEKPFPCKYCDKSFSILWNRQQHERLHTNSKPYKCPLCPAKYRHNVVLKSHMASSHTAQEIAAIKQNQNVSEEGGSSNDKSNLENQAAVEENS